MTFKEFDKLVQRYIQGECSPDEAERIEKWYASFAKNETEDSFSDHRKISVEERLWHALQQPVKIPARQSFLTLPYLGGMAAVFLVLIVGVVLLYSKTSILTSPAEITSNFKTKVVNSGKQEKLIVLEEGSIIMLYPGSEISYASAYFTKNREITLVGEAFFTVKKDSDHPFLVHSGGLVTKVLGTSFKVSAHKNVKEIIVSVKTGKVSVFTSNEYNQESIEHNLVLTPNQLAIYDPVADMVVKGREEEQGPAKSKHMAQVHFANVPVQEIFQIFRNTYGIEIQFDNKTLSSCTITTTMTNESLFEKLDIICQAIGAHYKIIDATVVIEGEGCD